MINLNYIRRTFGRPVKLKFKFYCPWCGKRAEHTFGDGKMYLDCDRCEATAEVKGIT